MLFIGSFGGQMESVCPMYIFSLTVFSPEGQVQAICKSPGRDAIHLKLPLPQPQAWNLALRLDESPMNATVLAAPEKTAQLPTEASRAHARAPAATGSRASLVLWNAPNVRHSCLILLTFLAFQSAKLAGFFGVLQVEAGLTWGASNFVGKSAQFSAI